MMSKSLIYFSILFEILHSLNGESSKGSLTFVIDDTGSMYDEIAQVKEKTNKLFDAVLNSNATKVDDFILVTFNDPGTKLRTITRDRNEFKRALADIVVDGGGDCPEYAMSGIELALEKSKPNSLFYVYTDASAKDYKHFDRVKSLSLKKSTKVTFLLTGQCNDFDEGFLVYDKLSAATSGEVFHIEKQDINKIIDYIIESVKHVKTTLAQKMFEGSGKTIQFNVDSKSWDIIVSVSATNPNFRVIGPDGEKVDIETYESKITKKSRIEKLKVKPGLHTIFLDTVGPTSVVVTASTSVTFEHGFSTIQPESLNETTTRPVPGEKSYLAISLDNYKKDVKLKNIEIRDLDDNVIYTFPLELINEDTQFYVTEAFMPPSKTFKLAVISYTETGEKIVRSGPTTIEPQDEKSEIVILNKKPTATIIGGPKLVVEYNEPLTIKCKVHAYPKPNVIWQDSTGTTLPSTVITVDLPYDYISILNLNNVRESTTLTCKAININGNNEASVNVQLNTFLQVLKQPKDTTIEYGESFTFKIDVNSNPPPKIVWFKNSAVITSNDKYDLSSDSSSLTLKESNYNLGGVYEIKVSNGYQDKIITFKVSIYAEMPKIDERNSNFIYKEGSNVVIKCNVIRGVPKPKIVWSYSDESGEISDLSEKSDTLRLENVKRNYTGTYLCTAVNEIGKYTHEISLFIEYPPSIDGKDENIQILKGKKVSLNCASEGEPNPSVKWFKNNVAISSSATHRIYNEHLRFKATFRDTGIYACEATNPLGKVKKIFNVNVYEKAYITPPKETVLNLNVGSSLSLSCGAHGYPKPEVHWTIYEFNSKVTSKTLRGDEKNTLTIPRIQIEDQGLYVCMANNTEEIAYLAYEVHVTAPPSIVNTLKDKTLKGVVGDLVLKIPCKVVGSPKPTITWMVDDDYLAVGTNFYDVEEDGTLLIKNLTKKSAGTYKCKAKNSVGSAAELFNVEIQENPYTDDPTENIMLEEGKSINIKCDLPHEKRDLVRWYKDGKIVATNELQLKNVVIEDSGVYTCRVSNYRYSYSSHKMITVGNKPKFWNEEENNIEFLEGATTILDCGASSYPPPAVKWYHNGLQIGETSMEIILEMNYSDVGNFTCIISNAFGEITRTYDINIQLPRECILNIENDFNGQQPLILKNRNQWQPFKNNEGFVIIPKLRRVRFVCPESYVTDETSSFTESVTATCLENSKFKIDDKVVDFKDLKCYKENKPLAKLIETGCGLESENTQLLTVGFNIRTEFLSVYNVCIDKDKKVPIFANYKLYPSSADVIPKALMNTKFRESKHLPYKFDYMYNCSNQLLSSFVIRKTDDMCCFTKRQLVSPKDVLPGLAQKATYNYLNVVPHWSTCGTENWDEVEYRVRQLVKSLNINLDVWTGSSQLIEAGGTSTYLSDDYYNKQPISPYIWKVLHNRETDEALAIIQINIRDLTFGDAVKHVPCKDICGEIEWMKSPNWYNTKKGFTICCSLEDFQKVFGYTELFISATRILAQNIVPKFALVL